MSRGIDRMTSMGLSNAAWDYFQAAATLRSKHDHLFIPTYLCACQAVELSLKAFLRGKGASKASLIKLGHDIVNCLSAAERSGVLKLVELDERERDVLASISHLYSGKDLQYPESGHKRHSHIDDILAVAGKIYRSTREFCEENRGHHFGKPTAVDWI